MLYDFADELPDAQMYAVAISDSLVCLSATGFSKTLDKEEIMEYFIGAEKKDQNPPEIFENLELQDEFVAVVHNGSEYIFLSFEDKTSYQYEATSTILLDLLYVYSYFEEPNENCKYFGEAEIGGLRYTFEVDVAYERVKNSDFCVRIAVNETYTVEDMSEVVAGEAGCSEIDAPRGVSSLNDYPVQELALDFGYNTGSSVCELVFGKFKFDAYDYAVAPDIYLQDVTGFVVVQYNDLSCGYETVGTWEYLNYTLALTVYDRNSTKKMEALGQFIDLEMLTMDTVDKDFYQEIFPEDTTLFPAFSPEDPAVISDFKTLEIHSPQIQLYFQPDTGFNLFGQNNSYTIEVIANRVNGTVESIVHSFVQNSEYSSLGFQTLQQDLYYASNDIDISEYYTMSSLFDPNRTTWTKEIWLEETVEFNDDCESNAYCEILLENSGAENGRLTIQGYMLDKEIVVDQPIENFLLTEGLEFQEAGLMIEYSSKAKIPTIVGAYYFNGDSKNVIRVEAEIRQGESLSALVVGQNYEVWKSALDVEYVNVVSVFVNATIDTPGHISSSIGKADAVVGDKCYNGKTFKSSCLSSSIDLNLDLTNYVYNSFSLYFYNISSLNFYNIILGYSFKDSESITLPYSALDFVAGLNIYHEYKKYFDMSGGVKFAGVYSKISGKIEALGGGTMNSEYEMEDFYFASSNARMTSPSGKLKLERDSDYYSSSITGKVHMWDVETEATISITNEFSLEFSGFAYSGLYNYTIHLEGQKDSEVTNATFNARLSLVQDTVSNTQEYLKSDLYTWLGTGLDSIEYLNNLQVSRSEELEKAEKETCDPEQECPNSVYCKDKVLKVCEKREIIQSCQEDSGLGCSNVQMVCVDSDEVCIKNSSCTSDCECLSTVTVCKKWRSSCRQESETCRDTYLHKDPDNCEKTKLDCEKEEVINKECRYSCEYMNALYLDEQEEYTSFTEGCNKTFTELIGYSELNDLITSQKELRDLVRLGELYTEKTLDESGIGPYDFEFKGESQLVSLENNGFSEYLLEFNWDFFNSYVNQETLVNVTRTGIIELGDKKFAEDLAYKSPYELIEENIYS